MGTPEERKMQLGLTHRQAGFLAGLVRAMKKKRERAIAKSRFVPAPGKYDMNKSEVSICDDLLGQLAAFDWHAKD